MLQDDQMSLAETFQSPQLGNFIDHLGDGHVEPFWRFSWLIHSVPLEGQLKLVALGFQLRNQVRLLSRVDFNPRHAAVAIVGYKPKHFLWR